jgi:predicted dehydrogenase/threonine dehydrogenase-like Zn-dependent dehydrogenase
MKQIAQYQDGRLEIQEVPMPTAPPGGVLVRTTHSVISAGTERMKVEQARMNLLQKARARPDQVRKVLDTARTLGWRSALEKVRNRLETPTPLGYSAAGIVVAVDPANTRFRVGDRVACAGADCAHHAEYLAMPDMLVVLVPTGVESWQAAYTTLCAIALHSVRQAEAGLGDRVLVIGQGLIGLLVTGFLVACGSRVMAVDLQSTRRHVSHAMGTERVVIPGQESLPDEVRAWTDGYGVDAALVCTGTQSNEPIEQAAEALRDRGRLVDVGITRMDLPWKTFYEKELEVRFSRSYGPGRYDPAYEWGGADYPIGYVRWTEQRNFEACLHLMASGRIDLAAITTRRARFVEAPRVYEELLAPDAGDIGVILEYDAPEGAAVSAPVSASASSTVAPTSSTPAQVAAPIERLDVIGAGNFARTMLLPHLKGRLVFGTVVNQTALSANHVKAKFGFERAATDAAEALAKDGDAALLIATRHHLHASMVCAGVAAGRHVFVEKPLCLTREQLGQIDAVVAESKGTVQVGFNRRFAPASRELRQRLAGIPGPKSATYRVLAGRLDPQHWYSNYAESGGRVLGEACHFLDYFCFLFDARPLRVVGQTIWPASGRLPFPDSVSAQVEFADGSCGQLVYSAESDRHYPKETLTVLAGGLIAEVADFRRLTIYAGGRRRVTTYSSKGHAEQMAVWSEFLSGRAGHPLPYQDARASMLLTFALLESIQQGGSVDVGG